MYTITETKKDTMNRCAKCQRIPCNYIGDYFTRGADVFLCYECRGKALTNRTEPIQTMPKVEPQSTQTIDRQEIKEKPVAKPKAKPQTKRKPATTARKATPKKKTAK